MCSSYNESRFEYVSVTIIIILIYNEKKDREAAKDFYKSQVTSIVTKVKSYHGRGGKFILKDEHTLYTMPEIKDKILIYDSINKNANTNKFKLYRKNYEGIYTLIGEFESG